ncbi:MAG: branched chain amino acid aminotransferase [Legionellales bacterium]|nr:branched chain amino acid aminotransferase [Legionellales bacterium]
MEKIDWDVLGFNVVETKSMFKATCKQGETWQEGGLVPYGKIELSPAAGVLNYGQGCFEGTKAFRTANNRVVLFRIDLNAKRMAVSTKRLCIPEMNKTFFINAVKETVLDNIDYVPPYNKGTLYVRPIVWGTSPAIGVKPVEEYTFMVFVSPVGPYFKGGIRPLHLKINKDYHRAAPKGIGHIKAIGNYSASLYPLSEAKSEGYDEVLYLDAKDDTFLEEVGSANLFLIKDKKLMTPQLGGSILAGVTRDSVLKIAKDKLGLDIIETDITLNELYNSDEVFCTGTAVSVSPVGSITDDDGVHSLSDGNIGPYTMKLKELLVGIQREDIDDDFGWLFPIE